MNLFVVLLLCVVAFVSAATPPTGFCYILIDGKYLTIGPIGSGGRYPLTFADTQTGLNNQAFTWNANGQIISKQFQPSLTIVLDIDGDVAALRNVIGWPAKTPLATNQRWAWNDDFSVESMKAAALYMIKIDNNPWVNFATPPAVSFPIWFAPTQTTATGPGLTSPIPKLTSMSFSIQKKDANGNSITTGGGRFEIISNPRLVINQRDNGDGTYSFLYSAIRAGTYVINIRNGGVDIFGSPYTIQVV